MDVAKPTRRRPTSVWWVGAVCFASMFTDGAYGVPAVLTRGASFEVREGKVLVGHRFYPTGTRVEATPAGNGRVSVMTEDGATTVVADAGVIMSAAPTPSPTVRPGMAAASPVISIENEGADLTTLSGKTYKQAMVYRVEPDGINYMFAGGMVKIPFTDLPEAVQKQFSYDPNKATIYAKQDAADQVRLAAQAQAQNAAARRKQVAAEAAQAAADEERAQRNASAH